MLGLNVGAVVVGKIEGRFDRITVGALVGLGEMKGFLLGIHVVEGLGDG